MSIDTPEELEGLRASGRIVAEALRAMRRAVRPGVIGATIERETAARGYAVCAELMGHGIGRRLHEAPDVPSVYDPGLSEPLTGGLVLTIEPIVSAGSGAVCQGRDGWTVCTAGGALSAHEEHTIVVTPGAPLVLTA